MYRNAAHRRWSCDAAINGCNPGNVFFFKFLFFIYFLLSLNFFSLRINFLSSFIRFNFYFFFLRFYLTTSFYPCIIPFLLLLLFFFIFSPISSNRIESHDDDSYNMYIHCIEKKKIVFSRIESRVKQILSNFYLKLNFLFFFYVLFFFCFSYNSDSSKRWMYHITRNIFFFIHIKNLIPPFLVSSDHISSSILSFDFKFFPVILSTSTFIHNEVRSANVKIEPKMCTCEFF